jgi:uncharacterized protein
LPLTGAAKSTSLHWKRTPRAASFCGKRVMHIGVMRLVLEIPGARSLKDKRQVVRSFKERVRARLGISIAEVDHADKLQRATFGVAVVSGDAGVCQEQLSHVTSMASSLPNALLADRAVEIIPFGRGGTGVRGGIESLADELETCGDDHDLPWGPDQADEPDGANDAYGADHGGDEDQEHKRR